MMLPHSPGSSSRVVVVLAVVAPWSVPRIEMLSRAMPIASSWSRADSAAARLSYIAVRMRSGMSRFPFLVFGLSRVAALEPLHLRPLRPERHRLPPPRDPLPPPPLRPERHRLADELGAAPLGDPDLLLEDQLRGDHEPFLEDGHDQDSVLLPHGRRRLDGPADRDALDADLLLPQGGLGDLLAAVDAGADDNPPALDLALADLEPLLDQLEAVWPLILLHR